MHSLYNQTVAQMINLGIFPIIMIKDYDHLDHDRTKNDHDQFLKN